MVYYLSGTQVGLDAVASLGDGYTISLKWFQAYPSTKKNKIAYNIYFSTVKEDVFTEGVKYVVLDGYSANIIDLVPGQDYFFSVRPVEYSSFYDLQNVLPAAYDNLKFYPSSLLRQDIGPTDLLIPLMDTEGFPSIGVIKIGVELIQYLAVDNINNNLILTNVSQRGFNNTSAALHTVSGFDGYHTYDPTINYFVITESNLWDRIFVCQCRFEYPNFPFTIVGGYRQETVDLLSTDLSSADDTNVTFPAYDYAGYHRTDPALLLNGACVGSYIGGQMGCIDGYGNYQVLRGMSLQDQNTQRQDLELSITGKSAVLIKRVHTGITCSCYLASSEYQDDRCPLCYGTKFVFGYEQYFNPRSSDGRILVRPGPTVENTKIYEAGLESEFPLELWTLTVPTIKTRDVIVLFDQNDNEEFRYEVGGVTRNNTILGLQGGQKLNVFRIRKYDPAYQIRIFRNTSDFPSKLNTSIGFTTGIPPHTHSIQISEKTLSVSQVNQTTSISQGHNHPVINGVVMEVLNHTHTIIL